MTWLVRRLGGLAGLAVACACQMGSDYSGTDYLCAAGRCPDGFVCVAGRCRMPGELDGGGGGDDATGPDSGGNTAQVVVVEAEHFTANVMQGEYPWIADSTEGHSGDGAMLAQGPGISAIIWPNYYTGSSRLDYTIRLDAASIYYVWIRGMAWSGSDTCIPGIDGTGWAGNANPSGALWVPVVNPIDWTWGSSDGLASERVTVAAASAGNHTLSVWLREDGVILDKILVTTDPEYVPTGSGPAETP